MKILLFYKFCIIKNIILLMLFVLSLTAQVIGQQQPLTSEGKEFWLAFMDKYVNVGAPTLKVYITSKNNTNGTISMPLAGWTKDFSVGANKSIAIVIPVNLGYSGSSEIVEQRGIHITSDNDVSVWASNGVNGTIDATNVLPTATIGKTPEYIIASYFGFLFVSNIIGPSEFIIVSTEDGTQVTITPSVKTFSGKPANVPFNVTLNKGETYQVKGDNTSDLTGTTVKPISGSYAVFSGDAATDIPVGCTAADHLYKQCYPIKSWGREYILTPFKYQTSGYVYRIIASENNTTVNIPSESKSVPLNSGNYYEENVGSEAAIYISADKPVSVVQYMKGIACNGFNINGSNKQDGDPAMLILNSNNQTVKQSVFKNITTGNIVTMQYVNIITKTADTDLVVLDGKKIISTNFVQVPSLNTYSYAKLEVDSGVHKISSDSGLIAYAYGVGWYETYIFTVGLGGGAQIVASVKIQSDKNQVCEGETVTFTATPKNGCTTQLSYQWYRNNVQLAMNNEQLILNNTTSNDAGSYYCVLKDGCSTLTSNTVMLTVIPPPVITFITPPKIKCSRDSIQFKLGIRNYELGISYQWYKNGSEINGATSSTYIKSVLMPVDAGTYSCIASNACGSNSEGTVLRMGTIPSLKDTVINITRIEGDSLIMFVSPSGTEPFAYQWLKNDTSITGATNFYYKIKSLSLKDSGNYSCEISNICGSIKQIIVKLAVQKDVHVNELRIEHGELRIYPNPANVVLSIEYLVSRKGLINLKIYDIIGNEVGTLVNEVKDKGEYKIEFDAGKLKNGVYFCKVEAGNESVTRKIVVVH
jgi:hypothetical protein